MFELLKKIFFFFFRIRKRKKLKPYDSMLFVAPPPIIPERPLAYYLSMATPISSV
tara:strand:+ start:1423 stop:1587 length:165 start_codon:yes stop_codon:yes gene_type:complete